MDPHQSHIPPLPDEAQLVLSEINSLKHNAFDFDLGDLFLEAEAQPLLDDFMMLDFMLQENDSPCGRSPSMEPQPHSAEAQDDRIAHPHRAAETKKRTRNESIIVAERLRRKKMRDLFSTLHSLLPVPTSQARTYCLIEEAGKYIQSLQIQLQELTTKRDRLLTQKELMNGSAKPAHLARQPMADPTSSRPDVRVDVYGTEAIVQIASFRRPRNLWRIYQELESNGLDIERADVYGGDLVFLHFHAKCSGMFIQRKCSLQTNLQNSY